MVSASLCWAELYEIVRVHHLEMSWESGWKLFGETGTPTWKKKKRKRKRRAGSGEREKKNSTGKKPTSSTSGKNDTWAFSTLLSPIFLFKLNFLV